MNETKYNNTVVHDKAEKFDPIVFVNAPISSVEEDIIGFESQVETLETAIEKGATMIGVVADYGTGKSSMTELLSKSVNKEEIISNSIKINLWDCENTQSGTDAKRKDVSDLTKSFLYQMANGYDRRFGRFINKILSKNYGNISFAISSWKSLPLFIVAAFLFGIYQVLSRSNTGIMKYFPECLNMFASIMKVSAPVFLILSVIFAGFALKNCCIAFSHWNMTNTRELEINDIFDIYNIIIQRLKPKKGKKVFIFIDDLDRFGNKDAVVEFLKELYRFQDSLGRDKERFVFIVSIKPESHLADVKSNEKRIYSKVFDTIISLKPIHFDDYDSILLKLLNYNAEEKVKLQRLIDCERLDIIPESFKWIKKGANLTLRDLKDRLNQAILILISLKNKNYKVETAAKFEPCAAIAYLESQYSKDYYELIKHEEKFASFMKESRSIINMGTEKQVGENLINAFKREFSKDSVDFSAGFVTDFCGMVKSGVFNYDFRMYFYTYPKGSHIKTTEERVVCDCLLFSNVKYEREEIYECIDRSYSKEANAAIGNVLKTLETFPAVILIHEKIFVHACEISLDNTLETFSKQAVEEGEEHIDYWSLIKYVPDKERSYFIERCIIKINNSLKRADLLLKKRMEIIKSLGDDIILFAKLYDNSFPNSPQIAMDEIELIPNPLVAIKLINIEKVKKDQIEYIMPLLVKRNLMNDSDAFSIASNIIYKFTDLITSEDVGHYVLEFLFTNKIIDDKLFEYVCKYCDSDKKIAEYLNVFEESEFTLGYLENIDCRRFSEYIKPEIVAKLLDNKLYCTPIIYYTVQNDLDKLNIYLKDVDLIMSACEKINDYSDIIISFRRYCYIRCNMNGYHNLYFGEYPLITNEEYNLIAETPNAIKLIDLSNVTEENMESFIDTICSKKYTSEELMLLFNHLLNEDYNDEYISDISLRSDFINRLDYSRLNLKQLSYEQRSEFYSIVENDLDISNVSDRIEYSKKFGCLIPKLEEQIQSRCDSHTYCEMIRDIDELSDLTFKWLETNYITVALSEGLCNQLRLKNYTKCDYVIAQSLRMGKLFIDESIQFKEYVQIYKDVDEMYDLMSNSQVFLTKLMNEGELSELSEDKLEKLFVLPQVERLFKYIFSQPNDAIKKKYLVNLTCFASEGDRESLRKMICSNDNMRLIPNKELCEEIRDKLCPSNPPKKRAFMSAWTRYWKNK